VRDALDRISRPDEQSSEGAFVAASIGETFSVVCVDH
jgi:hypothetical protein